MSAHIGTTHGVFRMVWDYAFTPQEAKLLRIIYPEAPSPSRPSGCLSGHLMGILTEHQWVEGIDALLGYAKQKRHIHSTAEHLLIVAVERGSFPMMNAAIARGAKEFVIAFIHAAMHKQEGLAVALIRKHITYGCLKSALNQAVHDGFGFAIPHLLARGAPIRQGLTFVAAMEGNLESARLLWDAEKPDIRSQHTKDAMLNACWYGRHDVVEFLQARGVMSPESNVRPGSV
jgi:hypothetical protein